MPTPLTALESLLPTRSFNVLSRHGFTTVEQVVEASDEEILDLPSLGPASLDAIREVVAAFLGVAPPGPYRPRRSVTLSHEQAVEAVALLRMLEHGGDAAAAVRAARLLRALI